MRLFCLGLAGLLFLCEGESDRVVLKDGKALTGRVVFEDESRLVLRQKSRDTTLAMEAVQRVDSRLRNLYVLLDNAQRADATDPEDLELLVSQAEECGLSGEAQVFWWRLLLLAHARGEENEAAHLALGHVKRGSGWRLPVGSRSVEWDKRFELAKDWGSALEFSSYHFRVRTNLPLELDLDVLLDLERFYRAFFEFLGPELGLYDVCQPMRVHLHADSASYPEVGLEAGRYDPIEDLVHLDASQRFAFETLAHEVTHQLLYDTAFREQKRDGEIPAWLNEGLAEYLAASIVRTPGLLVELGRPEARHFRAHAQAKDSLDLTRVLALSVGDYSSSSDRDLKYAQSYTLVHFFLHGEEGRYRAGFFEFLRTVYRGKGSSTDLKRCLGVAWRPLEKAWHAYARGMPF